ncbi:MAG: NAD-dependent epimerase/dehydratase family protein [Deltaproteobacteria bacterium]|nr:NAD-dependent epimerase/dehydratase family protein [Deltaproteobacteria bacterium]
MTQGKVLVTGASGFLGRRTVEILSERGFSVRALVRKTSKIDNLKRPEVEISFGDVSDISTLKPYFEGIDFVVHTAADTTGTKEGALRVTIGGTRNILDLCTKFPVQKLVYISSLSVYGLADCKDGQIIDENAPLERYPERRGVYSWSKIEAEKLVRDRMKKGTIPVVCLRPGTIYDPGGKLFTPMMGFSLGTKLFVTIGPVDLVLPLVYIDNLIDAILLTIQKRESIGKTYNVVDQKNPTKKRYVDFLLRKLYPKAKFVYIPYALVAVITSGQEMVMRSARRPPIMTRYRLISSQKKIRYDSSWLRLSMGWESSYSFEKVVQAVQ